jgi:polyphosphate kinase 2
MGQKSKDKSKAKGKSRSKGKNANPDQTLYFESADVQETPDSQVNPAEQVVDEVFTIESADDEVVRFNDDGSARIDDDKKADSKKDNPRTVIKKSVYERELEKLQLELVKLQEWVKFKGLKVVVIFEGRDAAGKGGVIKRITEALNPRICRVEALPVPTEKEQTQWYFQRYVARLPGAGEIVLFDRSWYNRAGVERVMGFCSEDELREFLRACPEFEKMLIRSGIILVKYWFSVSDDEQEKRFQDRINDPTKRWKLSPIDLESRSRWIEYSRAKDEMFAYTDTRQSPWYVVNADIKRHARLNCISHLLSLIPYEDLTPKPIKLPPRQNDTGYVRPPIGEQTFVPERYGARTT